jgi:WD40 repeat protein/serine/threonine protein kinase
MKTTPNEADIFLIAIELPSFEERADYLDRACGADVDLRGRVEALLRRHHESRGILDAPPPGIDAPLHADRRESPGAVIGRYKLLEEIGEGGFGVVYLAEQQRPVRRRVALKIIKPGMDTRQTVARFEAERQALAMMDHPNIAKVFDAGATEAGRSYFVMELVRGVAITDYCDQCNLTARERLKLFIPVCQAVNHAHQQGVIHRDLKPTNVLVAIQDGRPTPKIIDFGVAKAIGDNGRLTERTLATGFTQMLGTPLYMSPEQAELSPLGVDTRSDIYSLGVLLYELLTGCTPFDKKRLQEAAYDQLRQIICQEEPPRPSARISTLAADVATTVAEQRRTDPRRLRQHVRGDLDWIIMKCLDKDRNRRYDTAGRLAADIQRYLNDELIEARPPSIAYRVRKFARRHKSSLATAVTLFALAASMVAVAWQGQQTKIERRRVQQLASESRQRQYATDMRRAHKAWLAADVRQVLDLLGRHYPQPGQADLRSYDWHYLWRLCHAERSALHGHAGDVYRVAFSPNGKQLASAGRDGTVKLWDAASQRSILSCVGHASEVNGVAFSPDGRLLASASDDGTVRVWDAALGKELAVLRGHSEAVFNVLFSPDGNLLASAGKDAVVILWDTADFKQRATLRVQVGDVESIAFSPDGRTLASAGDDERGTLNLWDIDTGQLRTTLRGHPSPLHSVQFSPDGQTIATATEDSLVELLDVHTGIRRTALVGHHGIVREAAFSPDGKLLATSGQDATVQLWDLRTGQRLLTIIGHAGRVWCAAFSPDGRTLATAGADGTVKFWNPSRRLEFGTIPLGRFEHGRNWQPASRYFTFPPDGRSAIAALDSPGFDGPDAEIMIVDLFDGTREKRWPVTSNINVVQVSPDGTRLAIGGYPGYVRLIDLDSGREIRKLAGNKGYVMAMAFSPDGRQLAAGGQYSDIRILDSGTGVERARLKSRSAEVHDLVFSPDGRTLATAGETVEFWDVATAEFSMALEGDAGFRQIAFSPDGELIAAASVDRTVRLWEAQTGVQRAKLLGHGDDVTCVAFSPDGRTLASGSRDRLVKIWHVATGHELFTLAGHSDTVCALAFVFDGHSLASIAASPGQPAELLLWPPPDDP